MLHDPPKGTQLTNGRAGTHTQVCLAINLMLSSASGQFFFSLYFAEPSSCFCCIFSLHCFQLFFSLFRTPGFNLKCYRLTWVCREPQARAHTHTLVNSEHPCMCIVYPFCIRSVAPCLQKFLTKRRQMWPSN